MRILRGQGGSWLACRDKSSSFMTCFKEHKGSEAGGWEKTRKALLQFSSPSTQQMTMLYFGVSCSEPQQASSVQHQWKTSPLPSFPALRKRRQGHQSALEVQSRDRTAAGVGVKGALLEFLSCRSSILTEGKAAVQPDGWDSTRATVI